MFGHVKLRNCARQCQHQFNRNRQSSEDADKLLRPVLCDNDMYTYIFPNVPAPFLLNHPHLTRVSVACTTTPAGLDGVPAPPCEDVGAVACAPTTVLLLSNAASRLWTYSVVKNNSSCTACISASLSHSSSFVFACADCSAASSCLSRAIIAPTDLDMVRLLEPVRQATPLFRM